MGKHHRKWYIDEPIASNKKVQEMIDDLEEYGGRMSWQDNVMSEEEAKDYWWSMGEAVMREMLEDD